MRIKFSFKAIARHAAMAAIFLIMAGAPAKAEEIESIIRENCSGYSNCYTSLSAWEAAYGGIQFGTSCTAGNLVCADKSAVARIEGTWNNPDTSAVTINGWTTGSDNYIRVYTAPEARHDGKWKETAYRLQTSGTPIQSNEEYVRFDGLQVFMNNTNFSQWQRGILVNLGAAAADIRIANSIVRSNGNIGVNCGGIWFETTGPGSRYYITNTAIYGFKTNSDYAAGVRSLNANWTGYMYNVTSNANDYGFRNSGGTMIAKNCYAGGNSHAAYNGTIGKSNCASSDGTGSAGLTSVAYSVSGGASFNNVTLSSEDFHIKGNSALKDAGVVTSTEAAPLNFMVDIDGQTRSAPWDIGADEAGTVQSDLTPPSAPTSLVATSISSSQVNLAWSQSTDNVAVTGYWVYRDSVHIATVNALNYSNTGLSPSTIYLFGVSAVDAAGNESGRTNASTQTMTGAGPTDTSPPSAPGALSAAPVSSSQINLNWTASSDNVGVAKYWVFRAGVHVATVTTTSYSSAGLNPSTLYAFGVSALDSTGNQSGQAAVSTETLSAGSPPPPAAGNMNRINIQGKITDSAGNPVTGSKIVTFRLYETSTGPISSKIWEDSLGIYLTGGLFNVALGQNASLDAIVFNRPLYVGFQLAGDSAEMTPRQALGSSAFAAGSIGDFNAGKNLHVNGTIRGASWGFGGLYSVDSCGTNTTINSLTGATSCPVGFTSYQAGKFRAGDSNCADTLYVCVK